MMDFKRILILGTLTTLLVGCGDSGVTDLEAYVNKVEKRPAGAIEPFPQPSPYLPFQYAATFMRDPFQNQDTIIPIQEPETNDKKCILPDLARPKQYLESFDIGSFTMVGTLENDKEQYALLRGVGGVFRVKVGDYIGLNYGQVKSINDFGMQVLEKIPDGDDGCRERSYNLDLSN